MHFTQIEKRDLFYAGILISLAFAILLAGGLEGLLSLKSVIYLGFIIAFFTAGLGFLLHELMHKYIAQKYKLNAEFKAYYPGLLLALILSFFGFIIAAPGAVYISGFLTKERNGKISLAGPMTNVILAIIFLIPILFFNINSADNGFLNLLFRYGFNINALLALFNLIPVMPFDGFKIISWNKPIYFITVIISLALFITGFFL